jgi:DNA-directed RNA polymerase subunit RPC12/RpoP
LNYNPRGPCQNDYDIQPEAQPSMSNSSDPNSLTPFEDEAAPAMENRLGLAGADKDDIHCPHCGSTEVRVSHKHATDSAHVTYRCRACKRHFRVESPRARSKLMTGLAVAAVLVIAVVFGLFQEESPGNGNDPATAGTDDTDILRNAQTAARRGDAQSQYDLGRIHWQRGEYLQALPWIQAAASHKHAEAEYLLGMAYLQGRGTVQNYRSALEHFTRAAELGQLDAQYQLGIFHRDGMAMDSSKESAYLWLNLAAARGHQDALVLRDRLAAVMATEELIRAQEASEAALKRFNSVVAAAPAAGVAKEVASAPTNTTATTGSAPK